MTTYVSLEGAPLEGGRAQGLPDGVPVRRAGGTTLQWRVNCDCDQICTFCIGADELHEIKPDRVVPVIDKMIDGGVAEIVITGGEPLLSKRLDRILLHLRGRGVRTVLYTNCAYWDFHSDVLSECVDTICVPIEGASELVHDGVRGRDSLRKVLSVLDRHGRGDGPFTIRVGTVVGRHNLNELEAILYMLEQYEIEAWTLYKHIRYTDRVVRHYFRRNRADISMAELEAAVRRLRDGRANGPPILLSTEIVRDESLLLLNQELELAVPIRGADGCLSERVLGNAAAMEMSEILRTWRESVDITRCEEAVRVSL